MASMKHKEQGKIVLGSNNLGSLVEQADKHKRGATATKLMNPFVFGCYCYMFPSHRSMTGQKGGTRPRNKSQHKWGGRENVRDFKKLANVNRHANNPTTHAEICSVSVAKRVERGKLGEASITPAPHEAAGTCNQSWQSGCTEEHNAKIGAGWPFFP
jgi:hypothetical protein